MRHVQPRGTAVTARQRLLGDKASRPAAGGTAAVARQRLVDDAAIGPVNDARARLRALSDRLDAAARGAVTGHLAARVRTNRDFAPMLGSLMRMSLNA